ncbi:uncharacterized protein LOC134242743 [Saccostrea cucullata]|uniref:uncharacterized protein LOC134242743 n=1 Tax=Saccostrea cuccullata TaxID=36930 RepID=UPI002ED00A73
MCRRYPQTLQGETPDDERTAPEDEPEPLGDVAGEEQKSNNHFDGDDIPVRRRRKPHESGIQRLSESVYTGLCREVGTPTEVTIRRDVMDIVETFRNRKSSVDGDYAILSGSRREGFRLEGSDVDFMYSDNRFIVVWDLDQAQVHELGKRTLLLCDRSESPPGYTLLQVILSRGMTAELNETGFKMNNNFYISSSKYRQSFLSVSYTEHGPCIGRYPMDFAYCFHCNFWPPSASSWIDRSHSWPQRQVVQEIVRNRCHLVAIGHKLGRHEIHEWRISFSLAEQKLVYSMNHCQFLTYGLLKNFLKEVISSGIADQDKLLCSYHIKTSVFWVIQQNVIPHWCPQNILECFWICFKLLLKWVYEGVCPNFFIPENNMFLSKIHGEAQKLLFNRLYELYEKGIACLLHSSTIRPYVMKVLLNPKQYICIDEFNPRQSTLEICKTKMHLHITLLMEIKYSPFILPLDLHSCIQSLQTVEHLLSFPLTQYQVVWLQKQKVVYFHAIAFQLLNRWNNTCANKMKYKVDKMSCQMLRVAAKFDRISDILYLSMYHYRTSRYRKALSIIEKTKAKLAQTFESFNSIDSERFRERSLEQYFSAKRKQITRDIQLYSGLYYIYELIPEQSGKNRVLCIPPLVMSYMLEILCSIHTNTKRAQRALNDLQVLVQFDQEVYIYKIYKDISWQILGICQHIFGDIQSALFSYQQSLRQSPFNRIQTVTLMRIRDIMTSTQA